MYVQPTLAVKWQRSNKRVADIWQLPSRATNTSPIQYGLGASFSEALSFQHVFISSINSAEKNSGYSDSFQLADTPSHLPWLTPLSQLSEADRPADQLKPDLLEHFTEASNPIALIVPTHLEWTTACRALLSMAQSSPLLMAAICVHSALHLYTCNKYHYMLHCLQSLPIIKQQGHPVL